MKPEASGVLCIFLTFAVLEMWRTHFFRKPTQTRTDIWVELIGSPVLLLITQPFIMFVSYKLMGMAFPDAVGALSAIPIIAQVALLLVFDDMAQYWWHRASHSFSWLYNLCSPSASMAQI